MWMNVKQNLTFLASNQKEISYGHSSDTKWLL
jgi:hypothetical protein